MNLARIGALAARIGFSLASGATRSIVLKLGYESSYDVVSDTQAATAGSDLTVTAIEYDIENAEAPGDVHKRTWLVQASDLEGATITQQDTVVAEGHTWEILSAQPDPTRATIAIEVQRR